MQRSVALGHDSLWTLLQTEANTDGAAITGDAGASLVIRQAFRRGVPLSLQPLCPGANEARDASRLSMPGDLPHCLPAWPNVRAKRATTAGRQARAGENVPRTASPGLVACRWRSA
jgi:hypothetical protein